MAMAIIDFLFGFFEGITRSAATFVKLVLIAAVTIYLMERSLSKAIFNEPIHATVQKAGLVMKADFHALSDECRWVLGSVSEIDCGGTRFMGSDLIRSHLPSSLSMRITQDGADLVSIGVASVEGQIDTEEERAQTRASEMATWVSEQVEVTGHIWVINMGQFKRDCSDCNVADSSAQRPVILVTITHQDDPDLVRDLLKDSMKANAAIPNPDNYTQFKLVKLK
jgi:hypothetical protein